MTRAELQNCRKAAIARDRLRERIRELREDARGVSGVRYGGYHSGSNGEPLSRQQRYVEALERLAVQYEAVAADWARQAMQVEETLSVLPPDLHELMRLRYVEGWKWEQVNETLHVSEATSKRMHRKVVGILEI